MAKGRFLSTTIATDHQLAMLSMEAEALYMRAIPQLDRDGLITGDPVRLLAMIAPLRFSVLVNQCGDLVDEWIDVGLVMRYPSVDGPVLYFKGFAKNQTLRYDKERPSVYPAPPGYVRVDKVGLQRAVDLPWTEDQASDQAQKGGEIGKSPAKSGKVRPSTDFSAKNAEIGLQAEEEAEAEAEAEEEEQAEAAESPHYGQGPAAARPAAAGEMPEAGRLLADFGVENPSLARYKDRDADVVRGWLWEAKKARGRLRDPVAFVIARLKSGESPPRLLSAMEWAELQVEDDEDPDSYEALKRKYIPEGWEDVVKH